MKTRSTDTVLNRIGVALSNLRMKKGYDTIKEFAYDHDLPLVQYWRIEKGKTNVTVKTLNRLLSIHKLNIEEFFCTINKNL